MFSADSAVRGAGNVVQRGQLIFRFMQRHGGSKHRVDLPPERLAAASSLSNFTRTLAGSIGTSITTTLWTNRESMHHAQLTEAVNPYNPNAQQMYSQLQGMGMTEQQASGWIAQQITSQGLIISANEIFWISAGIFIVLLGLVWFARPPFGAGGGGGGAH